MSSLEQFFTTAVSVKDIEGVILAARDTSGNKYSNAFGHRTLLDGTQKSLSTTDIVFLASATKLLTTIAALQCCEKGQLSLDADLRSQLSTLCEQGVLLSYDDSPVIEPLRNPLTLRQLLTHSSGLTYDFFPGPIASWRAANPVPKGPSTIYTRYIQPFAFQPGEGWSYGPGIDWAGYLLEQASTMRLDEYFRKHLLEPLGVASTELSFFPVKEGLSDRMPDLNPKDPHGNGIMAGMGQNVHGEDGVAACFGGQGAYASVEAYIAVLHSILVNDGKLLHEETVHSMFTPQLSNLAREALASQMEGPFGRMFAQGTSGKEADFGLGGLFVGQDEDDAGLGQGSLLWGGGINTIWHLDPKNGACGIASLQLDLPVNIPKAQELKSPFRRGVRDWLDAKNI